LTAPTSLDADGLLDAAPCGFLSFADDGAILVVNRTLLDLLGYERAELLGRSVETIFSLASRIFYQTHFFPLVKLHARADEIFLLLRAKDGSDVGALVNAARRERAGAAVTDCALIQVKERRKYEDELLRARRVADEARAEVERQNRVLAHANQQLEEQAVELELQQEQLREQAAEMEMQGEALQATNEELERQRAAAEDANRAKSSFLAVMSHELRTPLNAIGGYVQLLALGIYGPLTDTQREALGRIARSQRHLLRLINDVLNLSRIESGRVEYAIEDVPLAATVQHVMPMLDPQIAAKGLRCSAEVDPALVARADREKVQQILINLLTNAVKFTLAGGRVTVTAGELPRRPGLVALHVADTGIGIPADKLAQVFEPFVQVDTSHTRPTEGSGLGLAISRDLARGMGGDLTAESEEGKGSTFTLTLPRV
jgi:PAS domain S-box-containing protein